MSEQIVGGAIIVTDGAEYDPKRINISFAVDAGNGETHAVGSDPTGGEFSREATFPSIVTVYGFSPAELLRKRRAGPGEWGKFGADEHLIRMGDDPLSTAVGDLALTLSRAGAQVTGLLGDDRRYLTLGPKLGLTALAAMYPQATHITAEVATGLPMGLWTEAFADDIATVWAGERRASGGRVGKTHKITYKGRDLTIVVTRCLVLAEGHAAWVTLPGERKVGYRLGLDLGARTVIPTVLDEGQVADSWQLELGAEWALDQLDSVAERPLTPRERHDLKRAIAAGAPSYSINLASGHADVMPMARRLFVQAGTAIVEQLYTTVDLSTFDGIDASGGGVLLPIWEGIQAECRKRGVESKLNRMDSPERRTAQGYYQQLTLRTPSRSGGKAKKSGARP